ncbi:MAG TPA: hypothetical protein VK892_18345 [Pyrinomonadaceae bacterium]|nr:hypothetical protein [Pyrinomonadaceae bacterium]
MSDLETAFSEITKFLYSHQEWLAVFSSGKTFSLQKAEIEITFEQNKILFGFLDEKGFQIWRVTDFKFENEKITLNLTRNFEKETEKINLVPRVSARELGEAVELARLEKANKIARLLAQEFRAAKLLRVALNQETGRFAQIIFQIQNGKQTAALADVSDQAVPENLLTTAILWLSNLERRKKNPVDTIWILAEKKTRKNLQKLHALLRENWRRKIKIFEISREGAKEQREEGLIEAADFDFFDLWREKAGKIHLTENAELSQMAQEILKIAPDEIDVLFSRNGETLRFRGLPFARVRKVFGEEKAWFGIEQNRQILSEKTWEDFLQLIESLKNNRRFDAPNKRHEFYRLAPESWLEFILRQNIKLLDANLILSPIYNQFRTDRDKIDLLALRRDGRLIIIELKVSPDREMIFQALDYWRKIELQRRAGTLQKAKVFGDLEIKNAPALVYLVAPTLSFHPHFDFLAGTVSKKVEIYRFDLNENWRENLKVLRRERV